MRRLTLLLVLTLAPSAFAELSYRRCGAVLAAGAFARHVHADQWYGPVPFAQHLYRVQSVLRRFGFQPVLAKDAPVFVVAWLHDVLEDTPTPFSELVRRFGVRTAKSVRALTLDATMPRRNALEACVGRMRRDRVAFAAKLADRIANVEVCREAHPQGDPSCYDEYVREWAYLRVAFRRLASSPRTWRMWRYLDSISALPPS